MEDIILVTHTNKITDEKLAGCFFCTNNIPDYYESCADMVRHPDFRFAHLETATTHIYFERIIIPRKVVRESLYN